MTQSSPIAALFQSKLIEQIELADKLVSHLSSGDLDWRPEAPADSIGGAPPASAFSMAELLGHLLDCLSGFCATLHAAHPNETAHFVKLRELPVNHRCEVEEARARLRDYESHIKEGFAVLSDADLTRSLPTVFVETGEPVMTLLLGNLEHLINHKHQLFSYLKLMGIPVSTRDLYRFR